MPEAIQLQATQCAICEAGTPNDELYEATLNDDAFSAAVFSARRLPDRIHYRMVRCSACSLVRSDPVVDHQVLSNLYARSTFDYSSELDNLRSTYGRYLARLDTLGVRKGALLEIGCGNGFLLEEAKSQGYANVRGVEPSPHAIAEAPDSVRDAIVCAMMEPDLFEPESFDVVCLFQVFDHIADPGALLDECLRILRPGGMVLCLNHNIEALPVRLLREKSPVIDVEHTYLYSPATMRRIFAKHGFRPRVTGPVFNHYSLAYLVRLVPIPGTIKRRLLNLLNGTRIGRTRVSVPIGNLYFVAQKPEVAA